MLKLSFSSYFSRHSNLCQFEIVIGPGNLMSHPTLCRLDTRRLNEKNTERENHSDEHEQFLHEHALVNQITCPKGTRWPLFSPIRCCSGNTRGESLFQQTRVDAPGLTNGHDLRTRCALTPLLLN